VAYRLEHPFDKDSTFYLRTSKGNPKKALSEALDKISDTVEEFRKQVKSLD